MEVFKKLRSVTQDHIPLGHANRTVPWTGPHLGRLGAGVEATDDGEGVGG